MNPWGNTLWKHVVEAFGGSIFGRRTTYVLVSELVGILNTYFYGSSFCGEGLVNIKIFHEVRNASRL